MSRYRKVDVRMWTDEKFRKLSAPQPCGQWLWFYLLTNKRTNNIPGLYESGEAEMAEVLGWSLEAFREAFREACVLGMVKADWKARVVWVPNAIKYNPPESPNVVRGWALCIEEVPECRLKTEALQHIKAFTEGLGEAFAKACAQAMPNQEQEQEQEQEESTTCASSDLQLLSAIENEPVSTSPKSKPACNETPPSELADLPLYAADTKLCRRWPELLAAWQHGYPGVDVIAEVTRAHTWEVSNPTKRKKDRPAFLARWLATAQDRPKPAQQAQKTFEDYERFIHVKTA